MISSISDDLDIGTWNYKKFDNRIHVDTSKPEKDMANIISHISNQGGAIENVRIYRSTLEDVFMKITGKSLKNDAISIDTEESLVNV